ncbi:NHS-like protein 1 [Oncorhynchus nerka]|uniref:NHS-like protein 1 n=1 Tax=Oncorhynchus nerka TaxID=8023 RepID=UPI0031B86DBC
MMTETEREDETASETDTEADTETETEAETERKADTETEAELERETDTENEADTEAEREADTEREAVPRQPQSVSVPYTELGRSEPEEIWVLQEEEEKEERKNCQKLGRREEEGEEEDRWRGAMEEEDSNDFESFSLEERRDSLSSPLSTDSLKGALLLPDLFIQEDEGELGGERMEWEERKEWEKREERCSLDTDGASSSTGSLTSREDNGEVFDISSAEKMVTPAPPRTTEDLFAAIHRSKRKVLGRRNSEEDRCRVFPLSSSSSFSSTPPVTPPSPSPALLQPLEVLGSSKVRGHRLGVSSSSDSFKALLLRKGSRCDPVARMSAAERLRSTAPKHMMATPHSQSSQSQSSWSQSSQSQSSRSQSSQSQSSQSSQSQSSQSSQSQSSQSSPSQSSQSQSSQSLCSQSQHSQSSQSQSSQSSPSQSSPSQSSQSQSSQSQHSQSSQSQSSRSSPSQSSQSQSSQSQHSQSSQSQSSRSSPSQSSQSHPLSDIHLQLGVESHTHTPQSFAPTHTVQLMTLHLPQSQSTHRHRRRAEWALTEGTLPLSSLSSPTYPSPSPSLWGWRPPRSRTPPCSSSRRFAARSRLPSSPMTAISEREGEGESMEGDGLAVTIGLGCDSCKTFGLVKLTDGRAEATNGSLDWQQSRSMETHTVLWVG